MTKLIGAADIGGMTTKLGLFDEKLNLLRSWSIPTDLSDSGADILPKLCESLLEQTRCMTSEQRYKTESDGLNVNGSPSKGQSDKIGFIDEQERKITYGDEFEYSDGSDGISLAGVGIAVPAAVDEHAVARNCTNIGWGTVDLKAELHKLMPDVDTFCFGNDATVAALGELELGAARKHVSAYLITLGTGVGGGYAGDGKVVSGAHGAAGEIGHMLINPHESSRCMCGRYGCLEQYASAAGIVRLARNILYLQHMDEANTGNASRYDTNADCAPAASDTQRPNKISAKANLKLNLNSNSDSDVDSDRVHIECLFKLDIPGEHSRLSELEHFDAKDICDAAKEGDKLSLYILDVFGKCMGLAMSSISCTIDPECFIIGGGMSNAGDIVLDTIRRGFARYAYPAAADTPIIQAELGNAAGIYGCAAMVIQNFQDDI